MRLIWNPTLYRFEAQFTDFATDQPLVKKAGFKTDGPPDWVWFSTKATPLAKLKGTPGLTISPEARTEFNAMYALEERNAELKAKAKDARKALKKKLDNDEKEATVEVMFNGKAYVDREDLPPMPPAENAFVPPPPPETKCFVCKAPVYDYEYAPDAHPACLWCQKIVLDIEGEL